MIYPKVKKLIKKKAKKIESTLLPGVDHIDSASIVPWLAFPFTVIALALRETVHYE